MNLKETVCLALFSGILLMSCNQEQFTPEIPTDNRIEGTGYFDFSTYEVQSIGVDFGKEQGACALLEVFTFDPSINVTPVFKTFLDDNGQFKGRIYLASWVETVWLKVSAVSANSVVKVSIKNGSISYSGKLDSISGGTDIKIPITQSNYEVLAYEDWLNHGDFDLNDVVVAHRRDITFGNDKHENTVQFVTDYFRNINSGGDEDAFCFEYFLDYLPEKDSNVSIRFSYTDDNRDFDDIDGPDVDWRSYDIPDSYIATRTRKGDSDGSLRKTFVLFANSRQSVGRTYRVERQFCGAKSKQDFEENYEMMDKLNPFIISHYIVDGEKLYDEVHVAGNTSLLTERAKNSSGWDNFFTEMVDNGSSQFPYGLRITEEINWSPAAEGVRIDFEYPEFSQWINTSLNSPSNKSYNRWFKNKK